ncbi:MAG: ATP synthase F0 subunit B [SAR324 cluster bacterium]|uniref:ATP synthase subunit b n=1 Tax=SAR324 cluster bacterium TaxID=2024889 RepID=A0A7X9FUL9_9DELT|nr:ATP synthase F0 subunit B [SAR324 cluster bacterium]
MTHLLRKLKKWIGFSLVIVLFESTNVCASGASHGTAHKSPGISSLIPYWVNFILFLGILYILLRKKVPLIWAERRDKIAEGIDKASVELKEAEAKLREARHNFDNVEEEISKVKALIRNEAAMEHDSILAEAKKKADLIIQRAKDTAASERSSAEKLLRREMGERVLLLARQRLLKQISPENDYQRRLCTMEAFKEMLH